MNAEHHGDEPRLPQELAALFAQFGGAGFVNQLQSAMRRGGGPVNWDLARQVALQIAVGGDRPVTDAERERETQAQHLAEHWLDEGSLPATSEAGRLRVTSRQEWVNAALQGLRPLVEPVAAASIRALVDLVTDQVDEAGFAEEAVVFFGGDVGAFGAVLEPLGAVLLGVQSGQVVGQLSRQLLGQFDLGVPTAERGTAWRIAVNVEETFAGYGLDPVEASIVLALHEGAARRQYQAVPWLAGHVASLVAAFAEGTTIDAERLHDLSQGLMADINPDDPDSLRAAMERAAQFRLEPTPQQRRVLERLQGVVSLLQAWARHEVVAAAEGRLPNYARVEEVLRRRRATQGDGERMLAGLLGLDLKPQDETVGDRFVAAVHDARGPEGLRRALAHPENLPDSDELADPSRWLVRMASGEDIPDDPSGLL